MTQRISACMLVLVAISSAQHRVDPRNTYHRIICVLPMVGTGEPNNPRRPQYAPWSAGLTSTSSAIPSAPDIIAFIQVPTDDGKFAIVEFVARDRKAFHEILADPTVMSFEKGAQSKSVIEAALKKLKKDFDLTKFEVVMP